MRWRELSGVDSNGQRMGRVGTGNGGHRISAPDTVISVVGNNGEQPGNENIVEATGGEGVERNQTI